VKQAEVEVKVEQISDSLISTLTSTLTFP